MFKQLFVLLMALSIFTTQTVQASTTEGLKAAYEDMHFALTVKWDQKDKAFQKAELEKFAAAVRDLQAKGLTNAQMVEFAKSEIKDAKAAKDLETAMTMIQINKMSSKEASAYMTETMKKSFSNGASWNGEVFVYLAVGLLIVALAVAIASSSSGSSSNGSTCYYDDVYVCDTYCYDDYYYGYTCYDDCYWTTDYVCY